MKCYYYLAPSLDSTHQISDDLHEVGVLDWFLHVITEDEAGLKREHLHSSNYLETTDIIRDGLIGLILGFIYLGGGIESSIAAHFAANFLFYTMSYVLPEILG